MSPVPTTANTANPRGMGYAVALGEDLFRGAFGPGRELQVETAPLEPPAFDTRSNAEELNEEFGRTFARSDFTGGEGLDFAHTREDRVNKDSRFFSSRGIDVSLPDLGSVRSVQLLHATDDIFGGLGGSDALSGEMAYVGGYLYTNSTNMVLRSADPTAASPTFAADNPHAGEVGTTVYGLAGLGDSVYAALEANGIHRRLSGAAWAHWSDIQATGIWAVKSRIIAAAEQSLYEATAGAAPTPLYTLPTAVYWRGVVDAGDAILAGATDGNIYAFAPDTTTGALRQYAQTLIEGESIRAVGAAQGMVFYATRHQTGSGYVGRLWRAELSHGLTIVNAQLLREWESTTVARYPTRIVAARDSVFTVVMDEERVASAWRYTLTNGALSESYRFNLGAGDPSTPSGLLVINDHLYAGFTKAGVWREVDTYESTGYLIGPLGDFFSSAVKSWVGARLDADDLPTVADGTTVNLYYSTDPEALTDAAHASWTLVQTWDTASDVTTQEIPMTGVESRYIAGKITMTPNAAATTSPVVRSFGFRAYPGGGGGSENVDQIIQVPLNVSDQLERPNKRRVKVKNLGQRDLARLQALQGEALTMTLYHPGGSTQYRGLVESIGAPKHNPERGSGSLYSMLRFRGREV